MEILLVIQSFFIGIVEWMEIHPVISAGLFTIFGILLSAILDVRKYTLNIIFKATNRIKQNIDTSKKLWIFNLFNNWNFNIFRDIKKAINESEREDFRQPIEPSASPPSPLNPNQITICKQITSITEVHSLNKFDPKDLYEDAVRERNSNGVESAAIKYYQLFHKIIRVLENIAVEKNAKTQIENLIAVVRGLDEMINKPIDPEALRRQFASCEKATLSVLAIIYEPN